MTAISRSFDLKVKEDRRFAVAVVADIVRHIFKSSMMLIIAQLLHPGQIPTLMDIE